MAKKFEGQRFGDTGEELKEIRPVAVTKKKEPQTKSIREIRRILTG